MRITDDKLRAALMTDAIPSEDTSIFLLEQLGMSEEERRSRKMNAGSVMSVRPANARSAHVLITGFAALAALAVIAVIAFKLIPSLRSPLAEGVSKIGNNAETNNEPGTAMENNTESGNGSGAGNDPEAAASEEPDPASPTEDEDTSADENTFLKVPIQPEELRWGMTVEEVIEILGDPAKRSANGSGIQLVYDQPMETPLGLCTDLRLVFDPKGISLSADRSIPLGLNYITAGYAGITEEEFNVRLAGLYGEYDAVRELQHPLEQIGAASGLRYILYEWDAWKLKNLPDLMEQYAQVQKAATDYLLVSSTAQSLRRDDMVLEIWLTSLEETAEDTGEESETAEEAESMPEPGAGPEDAEPGDMSEATLAPGISVTFDAVRYLIAAMPEKRWSYELEGLRFTMPVHWQKLGARFVRIDNDRATGPLGAVVYRGLNLCVFYKIPADMSEYGGDVLNYSAGRWDLGDGYYLDLDVHNWAFEIYSNGYVTTVDGNPDMRLEDLDPVTYDSDEDLADILYAVTGNNYDMDQIRDREDPAGSETITAGNDFINQYVFPNVTEAAEESALPSSYLTDYLQAEPFSYSILDDPGSVINCQIPDKVLNDMSDEELILAVLDYPFFDSLNGSFDTNEAWGDAMKTQFNGFRELSDRGDQSSSILAALNRCHDYIVDEYGWGQRNILGTLEELILYLDDSIDENSTIW